MMSNGDRLECQGCGNQEPIEEIQKRGHLSCCPERKMIPIRFLEEHNEAMPQDKIIELSTGYHAEPGKKGHLCDVYTTLNIPEGMERVYVGSLASNAVQAWATVAADALALNEDRSTKK